MAANQVRTPGNLGILQHAYIAAQHNAPPPSSFFCHVKASVHAPLNRHSLLILLRCTHPGLLCRAAARGVGVFEKKKSFRTGDKDDIHDFSFLPFLF